MAAALHALLVRAPRARRSATRLVLVKARTRPLLRAMAAATFTLSISWTSEEAVEHRVDGDGGGLDLVVHGIVLVALDQPVDHAVEGGREQQRLVLVVDVAQEPLDLGQEAHVGHAVGLVDDHDLEAAELDLLAVDQVDQAAGGGDDRLDAVGQRLDLLVHVGAAVDGDDPAADGLGQRGEHVVHLEGQLAGGARARGRGAGGARPWRSRSRRGRPKARVLPEPVLALPHTSRPARASAMVRRWMAKGSVDALARRGP